MNDYPDFERLELKHKPVLDKYFLDSPPEISEFTFTNLYSWRDYYNLQICCFEKMIIIKVTINGKDQFFPPIGQGDVKPVVKKILADYKTLFARVGERIALLFKEDSQVEVIFDRDNSDYLYKITDLIHLEGKKYDGKRNHINNFKKNYQYQYLQFNTQNVEGIINFEQYWCTLKNCDISEGLSGERKALKDMVENFSQFNLMAAGIKIKGDIKAVSIAEKLNPSTLVLHVLKADPNFSGLYQLMLNEFLVNQAKNFELLNMEEDLGIQGLRKAKLSYHPIGFVNKYKIIQNTDDYQ